MCIIPNSLNNINTSLLTDGAGRIQSLNECYAPVPSENDIPNQTAEITRALGLFVEDGHGAELRALNVEDRGRTSTHAGFFDRGHLEAMAKAALGLTTQAEGVYVTLNPLTRDVIADRNNRVLLAGPGDGATDADVVCRRWLLVDADPRRRSGISATDGEKALARQTADGVRAYLRGRGWPDPVLADSGNGYHLLYRVDLPAQDDELVQRVLQALAARFDTPAVSVDQKVFNPSRIVKLYGTQARKGDGTPERPHRWTALVDVPEPIGIVPTELLQALADESPRKASVASPSQPSPNGPGYRFGRQEVLSRAASYLQKVPPAISGQDGHGQTYRAACKLVLGFGLSVDEALPLLKVWNATCQPPWTERELLHKLQDADKQTGERGYLLRPGGGPDSSPTGSPDGVLEVMPTDEAGSERQDDDPARLASLFLRRRCQHADGQTLRYWRGDWYRWEGGRYRTADVEELQADLRQAADEEFCRLHRGRQKAWQALRAANPSVAGSAPKLQKVSRELVANVLAALQSAVLVRGVEAQPAWVDGTDGPHPAAELLAAANGLVHVPSYLAGRPEVLPTTPRLFTSMALDYPVDLGAPDPAAWLAFLGQLWPGDPDSVRALQEWFGYCLLPDTSQQKLLFLLGPPRSGKSTVARVLAAVVGEANVAGPTLSGLQGPFGLWPLIGKPVAVISDARLSGRADQAAVVERLLSVTGEDALTVDRKNREPVTLRLPTRLLLVSNELPRLADASGALVARALLLHARSSFLGREDPGLLPRLLAERPGILRWALDGLRTLRGRGRFAQPASGRALLSQMGELGSPVGAFVGQCCNEGPDRRVSKYQLFRAWKTWCEDRGHAAGSEATFGRNLQAAFPHVDGSTRESHGSRLWQYRGLELRPDAPLGLEPRP